MPVSRARRSKRSQKGRNKKEPPPPPPSPEHPDTQDYEISEEDEEDEEDLSIASDEDFDDDEELDSSLEDFIEVSQLKYIKQSFCCVIFTTSAVVHYCCDHVVDGVEGYHIRGGGRCKILGVLMTVPCSTVLQSRNIGGAIAPPVPPPLYMGSVRT